MILREVDQSENSLWWEYIISLLPQKVDKASYKYKFVKAAVTRN